MKSWIDKALLWHKMIIMETGGNDSSVDINKLESAILTVFNSFDGDDFYPTKEEKAARLCYNLITSHAFTDGNKRIGIHIMLLFLKNGGVKIDYETDELVSLGFDVANNKLSYNDIIIWIKKHKI